MDLPTNHFRRRLIAGEKQVGLWLNIGDPAVTEICAGAGFGWLCIDAERIPSTAHTMYAKEMALSAGGLTVRAH